MRLALLAFSMVCLIGHSNSLPSLFKRNRRSDQPSVSVVGGTAAAAGEFPFLSVLSLGEYLCGGSLIGKSHVLTAAHCVDSFTAADVNTFSAEINTLSINGGGTGSATRGVKAFFMHPSYDSNTQDNDVAILILDSPITTVKFSVLPSDSSATTLAPTTRKATTPSKINTTTPKLTTKTSKPTTKPAVTSTLKPTASTAKVPCSCTCPTTKPVVVNGQTTKKSAVLKDGKTFSTYENQMAVVAGWGTTSSGGSLSTVLLKANVTIQPNSICAKQYVDFVAADMLCASAPGKDTCQGDSGGPILVNGVQVGITSFGNGCADPNYAGVYTRVSAYVKWISSIMASNP